MILMPGIGVVAMSRFIAVLPTVDILIYNTDKFNTYHPVVNAYGGNLGSAAEIGFCYKTDSYNSNYPTINDSRVILGYGNGTFEQDILLDYGGVDYQIFTGQFMFRAYAKYGNTVVYGGLSGGFPYDYASLNKPTIYCALSLFGDGVVVQASLHMNEHWGVGSNQTDDHKFYIKYMDSQSNWFSYEADQYVTIYPIEFIPDVRPTWVSMYVEYYVNGQRYWGANQWGADTISIYRP